jgi:hypothetical protein
MLSKVTVPAVGETVTGFGADSALCVAIKTAMIPKTAKRAESLIDEFMIACPVQVAMIGTCRAIRAKKWLEIGDYGAISSASSRR